MLRTKTNDRTEGQGVTCPFVVQIDTREQMPYVFSGLRTNAKEGNKSIFVPIEFKSLQTGDYSIVGMSDKVIIERKSKEDLYGSVTRRDNFEGRLDRMAGIVQAGGYAAIMVEAAYMDMLNDPPKYSKLNPKALNRTLISWRQRYQGVDWWFVEGRESAEAVSFRILERYWLNQQED